MSFSADHPVAAPKPWSLNEVWNDVDAKLNTAKDNVENAFKDAAQDAFQSLSSLPGVSPDHYEPMIVDCPATRPAIRQAPGLSADEIQWLLKRRNQTAPHIGDFLNRVKIDGFDAATYLSSHGSNALPNIAIAASGGGYRAMLSGAGAIKAFDSRATNPSTLAGLLQASTYVAGLSGGSWLVGSIFVNNFTDIDTLQTSKDVWKLERNLSKGPDTTQGSKLNDEILYYLDLITSVAKKATAGFKVTVTDFWARALYRQFVKQTQGGPEYNAWSAIGQNQDFASGSIPMPLVVIEGRAPGETAIPTNTTIFEVTPWEMGSFDASLAGFAPLQCLGSNFSAGSLSPSDKCTVNFDNAAYIMGTSSSLFNQILPQDQPFIEKMPQWLQGPATKFLQKFSKDDLDIANYSPNPFYQWNTASNPSANTKELTLVDGGEDGQVIPNHPLIQDSRKVDVIFSLDNSGDLNGWANGNSLIATYTRQQAKVRGDQTHYPSIPDNNTILNQGLANHPTFFGCNETDSPLVVWMPLAPYS